MLRFLLQLSAMCLMVFMALTVVIRLMGREHPPDPVLYGFSVGCEGVSDPCWYGIVLGVTHFVDARNRLHQAGFEDIEGSAELRYSSDGCYVNLGEPAVMENANFLVVDIMVYGFGQCALLYLGDLINAIGNPVEVVSSTEVYYLMGNFIPYGEVILPGKVKVSVFYEHALGDWFSPYNRVFKIVLQENSVYTVGWHGFTPQWYFCQREPYANMCS